MRGKLILAAGLAASTTLMSGCLVAGSSRTYQSGTYVGRGTLAQIEPGKTNEEFVLASLGPPHQHPTSKITMDDGAELWKWEYTRRPSSSGAVFLLLASDTHHESRTVTSILFRDRIVERVWQDERATRTSPGGGGAGCGAGHRSSFRRPIPPRVVTRAPRAIALTPTPPTRPDLPGLPGPVWSDTGRMRRSFPEAPHGDRPQCSHLRIREDRPLRGP
jgi:hypothetical protein